MSAQAEDYPAGHSMFLTAILLNENPPTNITVVLSDYSDLAQIRTVLPFMANVSIVSESEEYPLLNGRTTYYVCKNHTCLPPTNMLED